MSGWGNFMITQQDFDREYITSRELCRDMGITRPTLFNARRKGFIPDGVYVGDIMIWRRSEIAPYLPEWRDRIARNKLRIGGASAA